MDYSKGVANRDFGQGKGKNQSQQDKLMSTVAKDNPDSILATNELKEFRGGKGTPPAPYGKKGHNF